MIDYVAREFDRLVVLQTKVQSQHYKSLHRKKEDFVLPIGPEAMYETEINKWEYCSLGELWTSDDLERENGNTQKKLDELIRKLNAYSHEIDSELNLEIGNYYAFQLWIVVGQIRFNSFIIRRISENLKPKKILCYTKSNRQTFMELRPDPDSIFGDVLIRSQLYKNVKCRVVDIEEQLNHVTLREKILSKLPVFIRVFLRRVRDSYSLVNTHEAIYNLLVIGGHGDWKSLNQFPSFNQVFRMQLPIDLISENGFKDSKLVELINNSIIYDNLLPYDVSKLAESIQADLALFVKKGNIVDKMMQSYDAIVTSVLTFPRDNFLAHRAARAGLPVIVWQHGEKGQTEFELISLYTELFYATDYFAYAPVVVDQYLPWIGKYRLKNVVEVGSIEKQIEWEGGESVVYATGKWFKTTLAGDHDRRLFKAHTTILGYLERYADKYPIILILGFAAGIINVFRSVKKLGFEVGFKKKNDKLH